MHSTTGCSTQVSQFQADNDRLGEDNDRLSAEVEGIRALMRQVGGAIALQASSCWPARGSKWPMIDEAVGTAPTSCLPSGASTLSGYA
jgi:hypothetical protein